MTVLLSWMGHPEQGSGIREEGTEGVATAWRVMEEGSGVRGQGTVVGVGGGVMRALGWLGYSWRAMRAPAALSTGLRGE
jgi:hypothetical protein